MLDVRLLLGLLVIGSCHEPVPDINVVDRFPDDRGSGGSHSGEGGADLTPDHQEGGLGGNGGEAGPSSGASSIGGQPHAATPPEVGGAEEAGSAGAMAGTGSGGREPRGGSDSGGSTPVGSLAAGAAGDESTSSPYWDSAVARFVIEGDILFRTTEEALDFLNASTQADRWDARTKRKLSYCVDASFEEHHAEILRAVQLASSSWESVADVAFSHVEDADDQCDANNDQVAFRVQPAPAAASFAVAGFYPSFPSSERTLYVDLTRAAWMQPRSLVGLLRHMLGHALGFRHEYLGERAYSDACKQLVDWRILTEHPSMSVMHYPWCVTTSGDLYVTLRDAYRAALRYDAPALAVGDAKGHLVARRLTDGVLYTYASDTRSWKALAQGIRDFIVTDDAIFVLPRDGFSLLMYREPDSPPAEVGAGGGQLIDCNGSLCATDDLAGDLFRFSRQSGNWDWVSPPMRKWVSTHSDLYALDDPGLTVQHLTANGWVGVGGPAADIFSAGATVYGYSPDASQVLADLDSSQRSAIGNVGSQLIACGGTLCRLSLDRTNIDVYQGAGHWLATQAPLPNRARYLRLSSHETGFLAALEDGNILHYNVGGGTWEAFGQP